MAKEEKQTPSYSFEKYQYGALAAKLHASEESSRYAPSALEVLAGAKGLNLGEEALKYHRAFGEQTKEQIQSAINVYAVRFEEERGKYKPIDMAAWYNSVLSDLDKEDKDKILGELGKHNETIESISEKYFIAADIIKNSEKHKKAKKKLHTEEQISEAKKTIEKYQNTMLVLQTLDNYKFEELRPEAVSAARKQELKGLASKL